VAGRSSEVGINSAEPIMCLAGAVVAPGRRRAARTAQF
jgi:hypothetical protein